MGYVTPDNVPGDHRQGRLLIPNDEHYIAAVRGALLELANARNWEQWNGITPEDAAQLGWISYLTFEIDEVTGMPFSGVKLHLLGSEPLASGQVWTAYFNDLIFDTDNYFDNAGNQDYVTVPGDGYYLVIANVTYSARPDGARIIQLRRRQDSHVFGRDDKYPTNSSGLFTQRLQEIVYLTAGDELELLIQHTASLSLSVQSFDWTPFLLVAKLG